MLKKVLQKAPYAFNMTRSVHFASQGLLLPLVEKLINPKSPLAFRDFSKNLQVAIPKINALYERDATNISQGVYPSDVLFEESLFQNYARLPFLIKDAVRANLQKKNRKNSEFSKESLEFAENMPEYYRRNFHFQNDGYLSDSSADLYDHQVEVLFSGSAQAMRRQIIPPLKQHFQNHKENELKFLEIGSGTGALTRALALAFPKAQITSLDLSPFYLKKAQQRLKDFKNINFQQGAGENLNFKDDSFDAVISCYLFHELPREIRSQVLLEMSRVLKTQGLLINGDSIQLHDDPDLDWALNQFPVNFHEPFYKGYSEDNLQQRMEEALKSPCESEIHFLTKVVYGTKK